MRGRKLKKKKKQIFVKKLSTPRSWSQEESLRVWTYGVISGWAKAKPLVKQDDDQRTWSEELLTFVQEIVLKCLLRHEDVLKGILATYIVLSFPEHRATALCSHWAPAACSVDPEGAGSVLCQSATSALSSCDLTGWIQRRRLRQP